MKIRKANQAEYPQVLEFYYSISDSMCDSPFRPTWRRRIYPVLDDLTGNLFIATEDSDGIIGAVLVNDHQGTGYENGVWRLLPNDNRDAGHQCHAALLRIGYV